MVVGKRVLYTEREEQHEACLAERRSCFQTCGRSWGFSTYFVSALGFLLYQSEHQRHPNSQESQPFTLMCMCVCVKLINMLLTWWAWDMRVVAAIQDGMRDIQGTKRRQPETATWVSPGQVRTPYSSPSIQENWLWTLVPKGHLLNTEPQREKTEWVAEREKNRVKYFLWAEKNGPRPRAIIHGVRWISSCFSCLHIWGKTGQELWHCWEPAMADVSTV